MKKRVSCWATPGNQQDLLKFVAAGGDFALLEKQGSLQ